MSDLKAINHGFKDNATPIGQELSTETVLHRCQNSESEAPKPWLSRQRPRTRTDCSAHGQIDLFGFEVLEWPDYPPVIEPNNAKSTKSISTYGWFPMNNSILSGFAAMFACKVPRAAHRMLLLARRQRMLCCIIMTYHTCIYIYIHLVECIPI